MSTDTAIMCEGGEGRSTFPVGCWIIDHPKGLVIFDTGLHQDLLGPSDRLTRVSQYFDVDIPKGHTLTHLLEQRDIDINRIQYIVLSHLHFDHCGGTAQIPNAEIIIQSAEWQAGQLDKNIEMGIYNPEDYHLGHTIRQVQGHHDLFGDGTITCVPTPGHTVGHQSLRVELESGPVILTADCAYWQSMFEGLLVPPHGYDIDQQRQSMQHLKHLSDAGCKLMFGHDAPQWQQVTGKVLT